jgi:hypothetical protein
MAIDGTCRFSLPCRVIGLHGDGAELETRHNRETTAAPRFCHRADPDNIRREAYLRKMPDVGTDADFSRIEGSIRDVNLAE